MTSVTGPAYAPSLDEQKLYADFMAEVQKRELSGSENFDKSVLTLSSAGLGLSVGYLKDYLPADPAAVPWLLYFSWLAFVIATISTLLSFMASGKAMDVQKVIAEKYYMQGDLDAFDSPNKWNTLTSWMNRLAATSFVVALGCTAAFFILITEGKRMINIKNLHQSAPELHQKGAPVPTMQKPASATAKPSLDSPASTPTPASGNQAAPAKQEQ